MEKSKAKLENLIFSALLLFFAVGAVGHIIKPTQNFMLDFTKYFLLIVSGLLSFFLFNPFDKKIFFWFIVIYVLTFLSEVIGVHTGLIFGNYSYGNILGKKIFGVPPVIGLNWVFVILGSYQFAQKLKFSKNESVFFASLLAVLFDFILEPVAIKLGYWSWKGGEIPNYNYFSWWVISLVALFFLSKLKVEFYTNLLYKFFIIQFFFFLIINIGL